MKKFIAGSALVALILACPVTPAEPGKATVRGVDRNRSERALTYQLLAPRVTSSSSSCPNVSTIASAAPVPAASRAPFDG